MKANQSEPGLLFPIEIEPPTPSRPPSVQQPPIANNEPPAPSLSSLPREELLEHVFQSMCQNRRWERELLFGADDEELGFSMGRCFCLSDELNLTFQTECEPVLTVNYRVFDVPLATASATECAQYIRRIAGIPQKKSPAERAALLAKKLDEIRDERR